MVPHLFYQTFQLPYGNHTKPFCGYFWKITDTCERCFWDVPEMSQKRHLFRDMFETSLRRHAKDVFFEMILRRLIDVTKKTSFLRCIWDVLKTSQNSRLFWGVSKRSLRCLSQWRSDWDLSETSHAGWVNIWTLYFPCHAFYIQKAKKTILREFQVSVNGIKHVRKLKNIAVLLFMIEACQG